MLLLREINDLEYKIELNGSTPEKLLQIDNKKSNLEISKNNLPTPEQLDLLNLNCLDDIFLEVSMGNIRNSIISFQSWTKKVSNLKKSLLITRINALRDNFLVNSNKISALQEELNRLVELEIREKILNMKLFEGLHSEKQSPIFLALAKSRNTGNLSLMKDDTGSEFISPAAQGDYVASYYEKPLQGSPNEDLANDRIVEDFLGEDICSSQIVRNSKITEGESVRLEAPLTLDELDKSINNCNLRSAPGLDGFNNSWPLLRRPLLKYAIHCFNTGELTSNFCGAYIRLIPKKDNCSSIKNWRPISILSNMYKIISRALNARLDKVVNRICSRSQKGFNRTRYTQEVLINVWETINHCKRQNIDAAIVAVDMVKAFNTLSNNFLDKVLKFFNFGPNIRRWLALIGNSVLHVYCLRMV